MLLIVPYGIEMGVTADKQKVYQKLLIVPYGIEISLKASVNNSETLLIVPYGIEINLDLLKEACEEFF